MKKITARVLIVCLLLLQIFSLVACNNTPESNLPSDRTGSSNGLLITPNTNTDNTSNTNNTDNDNTHPPTLSDSGIQNIILIIGDGMGLQQIRAGELVEGKDYSFTNWQNTRSNTDSVNTSGKVGTTTDSAAGATALATGTLTVNGYVGKDHKGKDVRDRKSVV